MPTVLQDADLVFAHLPGDEGDPWGEEEEGDREERGKKRGWRERGDVDINIYRFSFTFLK